MASITVSEISRPDHKVATAMEESLVELRKHALLQEMISSANEISRQGFSAVAVNKDPHSQGGVLAAALNSTGVKLKMLPQEDDLSALQVASSSRGEIVALLPLQQTGSETTLPLNPTGENILSAIVRRHARAVIPNITMPYGPEGGEVVMGVVAGSRI